MSDKTLHQYYLSLFPNLLGELYFFIPENEIREDIIEKMDFLKTYDLLNKVYVLDNFHGPMLYENGRNNKHLIQKRHYFERLPLKTLYIKG